MLENEFYALSLVTLIPEMRVWNPRYVSVHKALGANLNGGVGVGLYLSRLSLCNGLAKFV